MAKKESWPYGGEETRVLHAHEKAPTYTGFSLLQLVPVARVPQFYRPHLDLLLRFVDLDPVTRISVRRIVPR